MSALPELNCWFVKALSGSFLWSSGHVGPRNWVEFSEGVVMIWNQWSVNGTCILVQCWQRSGFLLLTVCRVCVLSKRQPNWLLRSLLSLASAWRAHFWCIFSFCSNLRKLLPSCWLQYKICYCVCCGEVAPQRQWSESSLILSACGQSSVKWLSLGFEVMFQA